MLTHISTDDATPDPLFNVIALERYFKITNSTIFCFVKTFFFFFAARVETALPTVSFVPVMDVSVAVLWSCLALVQLVNTNAYDFSGQSSTVSYLQK
jgi:hypothetical protein